MIKLDDRLSAVAAFVRRGSLVADVGCDHAYLAIWLVKNNVARHVIASDINEKPLYRAQKNIIAENAQERVTLRRCSGLTGMERYDPEDIIIAGMGGEMIMSVLTGAPFVKKSGIRLIMQPMTRPDRLRRYLCREGYTVTGEALTSADGKLYQIICAEYTDGIPKTLSPAEMLLGRLNIAARGELFEQYLERQIALTSARYEAKRGAGHECRDDEALLVELKHIRLDGRRSERKPREKKPRAVKKSQPEQ